MTNRVATMTLKPKSPDYPVMDFSSLRGLKDLPDALIEAHLKLYEGYVGAINLLQGSLRGKPPNAAPEWAELKRRMGFEINGMRLHELYFGNLAPRGHAPSKSCEEAMAGGWTSFESWEKEFRAIGQMRGVGWAILYKDPQTGRLSNHWIGLHEEGHPAGFTPILVMDVWEHAFTGMPRPRYVDAFFANIDWESVESRLTS